MAGRRGGRNATASTHMCLERAARPDSCVAFRSGARRVVIARTCFLSVAEQDRRERLVRLVRRRLSRLRRGRRCACPRQQGIRARGAMRRPRTVVHASDAAEEEVHRRRLAARHLAVLSQLPPRGRGVIRDIVMAWRWLEIVAGAGDAHARRRARQLARAAAAPPPARRAAASAAREAKVRKRKPRHGLRFRAWRARLRRWRPP